MRATTLRGVALYRCQTLVLRVQVEVAVEAVEELVLVPDH